MTTLVNPRIPSVQVNIRSDDVEITADTVCIGPPGLGRASIDCRKFMIPAASLEEESPNETFYRYHLETLQLMVPPRKPANYP